MHDLSRHELSGVVIVCRDLEEALEMGLMHVCLVMS